MRRPDCGSYHVGRKGSYRREFRAVPIGGKTVTIILNVPRVQCHACGSIKQIHLTFAKEHKRYTRFFETYVLDLLQLLTCQDAADHLGVSWDTIRDVEKEYLQKRFANPSLKDVTHIAIDEIALQKGHKYLTVVMDWKIGRAIFVGDGKGEESLKPFWKKLRRAKANIVAAADMSPAYASAIRQNLPDALHVLDRFHVIKLFNEQLMELRRRLFRETLDKDLKTALKGVRFLLVKHAYNLDVTKNEAERLQNALDLNHDLYVAYLLKEDFDEFWEQEEKVSASRFLLRWIQTAEATNIPELQRFAKTLRNHADQLINDVT
ncbi:MAG: ISL3 family transposase, partial [Planctomycetaceae bacterium]|nr:ISL3 family transposase [Planctomycetaceae bacterium]